MNKNLREIIERKLKEQEQSVLKTIKNSRSFKVKRYDMEIDETPEGYKVSLPIVLYPTSDTSIIRPLTFFEASQKYQSVVLSVDAKMQK